MKIVVSKIAVWVVLFAGSAQGAGAPVSFYSVAHEDDWQLFMGHNAYLDLQNPGAKTVIIHLTAGDAGEGAGSHERAFFRAREEGAKRAMRFVADTGSRPALGTSTIASVHGHSLSKYTYKNKVAYFFRLPDGFFEGEGAPSTGNLSLLKLRKEQIDSLSAVDGSAVYRGWADLQDTLKALVYAEAAGASEATIHLQEPDPQLSPADHSDHSNSGLAMLEVADQLPCIHVVFYVGYDIASRAINLTPEMTINHAGVFAATASGIIDEGFFGTWDGPHKRFLGRQYVSRERPGTGPRCF